MKSLKLFFLGICVLFASNASATTYYFYSEDPNAYMHVLLYLDRESTEPIVRPVVDSLYSGQIYLGDGHFNLLLDETTDHYYFDLLFTRPAETNPIYPYNSEFFNSSVATSAGGLLPTENGHGYNPETEMLSISSGPSLNYTSFSFPDLDLPPLFPGSRNNLVDNGGGHLKFSASSGFAATSIPGAHTIEINIHVPSLIYAGTSKPNRPGTPWAEVPEPSTLILLLVSLIGLIKSRLRDAQVR